MDFGKFWGGAAAPYEIENSLRFRGSQKLYRTPSPTGNRRVWTISAWAKHSFNSTQGAGYLLFTGTSSTNTNQFGCALRNWDNDNGKVSFYMKPGGSNQYRYTAAMLRDNSAWYHHVMSYNNGTFRYWLNGVEQTLTGSFSNFDTGVNSGLQHRIGYGANSSAQEWAFFDGYMAEYHLLDGTAVTDPTTFGEFNADGVWVPIEVTGVTYGTCGFYLDFSDPSNIGADRSGNGNNFTASGFELSNTSSFNYDWTDDSPTKNYATLNHIFRGANNPDAREANLMFNSGGFWSGTMATIGPIEPGTGTYYWEVFGNSDTYCAIADYNNLSAVRNLTNPGATSGFASFRANGTNAYIDTTTYGGIPTWNNQWTSFTLNTDNNTLKMERSGGTYTLNYASGSMANDPLLVVTAAYSSQARVNYGQRPLQRTQTAGSKLLAASELPDVAIENPRNCFNAVTYAGNSSNRSINVGFQPDLVWIKAYNINGADHVWTDSARGATKVLRSNLANGEYTQSDSLTAFTSTGFNLGSDTSGGPSGNFNLSGRNYVAWCWKKQTGVFDVVTYSGTSSAQTIAHNLGVAPALMIVRCRNATASWQVYHKDLGNRAAMFLDQTSTGVRNDNSRWNSTSPTPTHFTVGTDGGMNGSGRTFVAYLFAEVPGFSAFGRYLGNANTDGVYIYTGFRPAFLIYKSTTSTSDNWFTYDTTRDTYNPAYKALRADTAINEKTSAADIPIDILSNGFKMRFSGTAGNGNSYEYLYIAFAEHPFGGDNVSPAPAR